MKEKGGSAQGAGTTPIPTNYLRQEEGYMTEKTFDGKSVRARGARLLCDEEGYMTEKIFNGLFAPAVPIYFGAPDVTEYINPEAFVLCEIADSKVRSAP
eukprot:174388-Prorocentrum_minimum.AAC.1